MLIGVDVGGTNTDAVLLSKEGLKRKIKVPTNPLDLFNTVLSSLDLLLRGLTSLGSKGLSSAQPLPPMLLFKNE